MSLYVYLHLMRKPLIQSRIKFQNPTSILQSIKSVLMSKTLH